MNTQYVPMPTIESASRYKPLPEWDIQVARRLAALRRFHGYSQKALAGQLSMNQSKLTNIECGRELLDIKTGWNACKMLNIRPGWLLVDGDRQSPFPTLDPEIMDFANDYVAQQDGKPFSKAFPWLDWFLSCSDSDPIRANQLSVWRAWKAKESQESSAVQAGVESTAAPAPKDFPEKALTVGAVELTTSPVKAILPTLLERLRRATSERGQKTELATWLGVPRQSLNDWLSGRKEPSGETTLRLQHWVEQAERQPKQPSPGATSP